MKKVLYITLIILTSVLVGYVLASLSSGQETRKISTEVTSTQTTGYQVKVPKFTNNKTLAKQETYFEQIENLDQLYFYNLDENEDLEAVTYEHKINNENSMQEWEGSINIYKKQNDEWDKVYTHNLTPQIKGDESYFDLRGYIIPLTENKPELLVQDSTNGSGLFTKQIHIKYEGGSYIASETPTHQTNSLKLYDFPNSTPTTSMNKGVEITTESGHLGFITRAIGVLAGGFVGAFIALWLEKQTKPKLVITCPEEIHNDNHYDSPRGPNVSRAKFFRVRIENKQLNPLFRLITTRETAEQVSAKITFFDLDGEDKTMKGRWAGTIELPYASRDERLRLALFPENETLRAGQSEPLDVFIKIERDRNAYGWNNEAYFDQWLWRNPNYELAPGKYIVEVVVTCINGVSKNAKFKAYIGKNISETFLEKVKN